MIAPVPLHCFSITFVSLRYPVLEPRFVRWAVSKIRNHADRSRKTTRREEINKVTPFRRYRFFRRTRIPGLVRNSPGTRICAKTVQRRLKGALTSPIGWCSVNCLHKRVRLKWTTTHCMLDDIGMKLFLRKTSEMIRHFFN